MACSTVILHLNSKIFRYTVLDYFLATIRFSNEEQKKSVLKQIAPSAYKIYQQNFLKVAV